MAKEQEKNGVARKPSFFLYTLPFALASGIIKKKFNVHIDNSEIKDIEAPVLALATHASHLDVVVDMIALKPKKYNIVAAKDLFTWKKFRPFIEKFGAIPMTQSGMDLASVRTIKNSVDAGRNILLYPEGHTSLDGKNLYYLAPSIGKLVKMLNCNVVILNNYGTYICKPRFVHGTRKGRVEVKAQVLFRKEEIATLKPTEITEKITEALKFNDNLWQQENEVHFKSKELAKGIDYILYKCPRCGAEYSRHTEGDKWICNECGNTVQYTETGHIIPVLDGVAIDRIDLWVDYERDTLLEEMSREDFKLQAQVEAFKRDDAKHEYIQIGEGDFFVDNKEIGYVGTDDGAYRELKVPISSLPVVVTKNIEGIDLVVEGVTYRFLFKEKKYSYKYSLVVENAFKKLNNLI